MKIFKLTVCKICKRRIAQGATIVVKLRFFSSIRIPFTVFFVDDPKLFFLYFLAVKKLYDLHTGQPLLNKRVEIGYLGAHFDKGYFHGFLEKSGSNKDNGQYGKNDKRQFPIENKHGQSGSHHFQQIRYDYKKTLTE